MLIIEGNTADKERAIVLKLKKDTEIVLFHKSNNVLQVLAPSLSIDVEFYVLEPFCMVSLHEEITDQCIENKVGYVVIE